jgi:hypothetical protein
MRRAHARFVRVEVCRDAHGRQANVMRRALRGTASGSHDADAFRLALSGIIAEPGSTVGNSG